MRGATGNGLSLFVSGRGVFVDLWKFVLTRTFDKCFLGLLFDKGNRFGIFTFVQPLLFQGINNILIAIRTGEIYTFTTILIYFTNKLSDYIVAQYISPIYFFFNLPSYFKPSNRACLSSTGARNRSPLPSC